ncbi:heparinase II/III family protein [Emcibacter sp.]|uniref:heparinase II/III family protein n=1 Tax=Emcibacter sp. TaxID=1979954 RepID=UPI002AA8030C|nr:heparinase II/III family protein [Emcibacter sp.]
MAELRRPSVRPFSAKMPARFKSAVRQAGYKTRYYDMRLKGKHPLRLLGTPKDPWLGSVAGGAHILARRFFCAGQVLRNPAHENGEWTPAQIWSIDNLSDQWRDYLHSFAWLRDLNRAVDRLSARKRAMELVSGWLDIYENWDEYAWRSDLAGRRIVNWLAYAPLILDTDDLVYRSRVLNSLARQARHLMHESSDFPPGPDRLLAISGLIQGGLFIPHGEDWLKRGLALLKRELSEEVYPDGGVSSRNPEDVLRLLKDLIMLRSACRGMGHQVPEELVAGIARLAGLLRMLCHGDGRLALFNGASEGSGDDIRKTLEAAGQGDDLQLDAVQAGFRRLEKAGTSIIVDSGPPALPDISRNCHAGTLSFEMSSHAQRMIVNCGSGAFYPREDGVDLFTISRITAAHSTLVLNNRNSSEILDNGLIGAGPTVVSSRRLEERGDVLLESCHNGYEDRFGRKHWRLLYLNREGDDIRGEDILEVTSNRVETMPFDIRFHLHPDVAASVLENRNKVKLRLPNDEVWMFVSRGAEMSLEDSLYLGAPGRMQRSRQIVLSAMAGEEDSVVKWAIKRIIDA